MKEDFVSFETAKLLKEKGFNWECISYYVVDEPNDVKYSFLEETNSTWESRCCSAPTLQMAMKWLREVHGLYFWIAHKLKQNKGLPWYYGIHNIETGTVVKIGDVVCGSYEAACEAAIKYCLENLI